MGKGLESRMSALEDVCDRERQGNRRPPRYSDKVKELVRSLSGAGAEVSALAQTAGVSVSAIRTWLDDRATGTAVAQPVRVLKVEDVRDGAEQRRVILVVRAADYEVVLYAPERGRL